MNAMMSVVTSTTTKRFRDSAFALASIALITMIIHAPAGAAPLKNAPNCGKQALRHEAIKKPTHGVDMYVYPRADQIDKQYSGCQNIWLEDGFLLAQAKYENGDIRRYKAWDPKSKKAFSCEYANGKLLKAKPEAADCPPTDAFPLNRE